MVDPKICLPIGNPLKLLVVAAWEPELAHFRGRSADRPGIELVIETVGVGLVEASIAMTHCIARHRPTAALLLGTCGVFASAAMACPVGSVVAGARVRIASASLAAKAAALPAPMPAEATFDAGIHDALVAAGARSVQIANTIGITIDDGLAANLAGSGDVEHLEAFAFARACASAGLPCGAVLGVANVVGASGRAEWLAGHVGASANAANVAIAALDAVAQIRTSTTAP